MLNRLFNKARARGPRPGRTRGTNEDHDIQPSTSAPDNLRDSERPQGNAFGLELIEPGEEPIVDIVAVHGLDGHREMSWTADNGVMWLRQLMPKELPHARVLTYGYDSRTRSSEYLTHQTLYGHSMTLVSALSLYRRRTKMLIRESEKTERRPIIFLAHSLGGILVKSALIHSNIADIANNEHLKWIKLSTYGIIFFGTPHQGTDKASWGRLVLNVASIFQHTSTGILKHLETDSEWLEIQLEQYKSISSDIFTIFCFESYPTLISGSSMIIVPKSSAVVAGAIDAESIEIRKDHLNLVKFQDISDDDFQTVVGHLSLMSERAQEQVTRNWARWDEIKAIRAEAWTDDFNIPLVLSYSRNPNFTGRQRDLDYIHKYLNETRQKETHATPLVIHGTGGIGKTQLVREYIYAHAADFSLVLWIDARSVQNTQNSFVAFVQRLLDFYVGKSMVNPPPYARIARHLGIASFVDDAGHLTMNHADMDRVVSAATRWLEREGNTNWLLIFDNVDDLDTFRISDFFPNSASGNIILTSRRRECSRLGEGWRVEVMEAQEGISLLSKSYARNIQITDDDYDEAKRLVEKLGCLPLAIDQAGSYLYRLSKPLNAFLPLFEANFKSTLSKKPPSGLWQYGEETVVTTWEISFKAIQAEDPQAARLLLLCSFLANDDINSDFLYRGLPELFSERSQVDDHMSTLFSFSLAFRKQEDGFSIHPVVHSWARERLSPSEAEEVGTAALRMIACAIDHSQTRQVDTDRQIIQHITRCYGLSVRKIFYAGKYSEDDFAEVWSSFAMMYGYQAHNKEAEEMWKRALAGCEKKLGPEHPDTLGVVQNLGGLYHDRGQVNEAEKMWKRALAGYEKVLEPDHPHTLVVMQNLGRLYHGRGQVDEAEKMWKWALAGYEKALEPDHLDTLRVVQNLGLLYHDRGQFDEAEKIWKRALAGYEKALEPDHLDTLRVVQNLGGLYHGRGQVDEAEKMWKQALAGYERALELDHPHTLMVVQNLGLLYHGWGQVNEAEKMWKRALAGYEKSLEPDHPDILRVMQNLSSLYHDRGQVDEAEKMWKRVLAEYEKALEPDHPHTLVVMQNLGLLYHGRGQVDEAEKMWKRALAGYEKALEPGHPYTLAVMQNLGLLYHDRGQVDEAEKMWEWALAGYEKALEPDRPHTLMVVQNLGVLYHGRGQVDEAEKMWKRALAGYEKALEPDHLYTLRVVQNLGVLYRGQGQADEAEKMWKRALTGYEKALKPDHPDILGVVQNLGRLYHDQGQIDKAEKMWKRALAGYEKALEPDHLYTLRVVQNLGVLYRGQGLADEAEKMWKRALTGYEKALELDHPDTLGVVQNLGLLYYDQGQIDKAEKMWKQALAGYEKALEPDHPDILRVVQNLGMLYYGRGQADKAEKMWKQALAEYEKALKPDHPDILGVVQNLGMLYHDRGQVDEAEKMWKRALAGYGKVLEPDHPDTLGVVQNLGRLYHGRGQVDEAEKMWKMWKRGTGRI